MEHTWYFEPHHEGLLAQLKLLGERELEPREQSWLKSPPQSVDAEDQHARELLAVLAREGLTRYAVPAEGAAIDRRALCLIRETLGFCSSLADFMFAMQGLGSHALVLGGDKTQQDRWLPGVGRGEIISAFALTEPQAGSDVGNIQTTARRDGPHWRLDGQKCYISNAGLAGMYTLFARTGGPGTKGLSAFIVPGDSPGLHITRRHEVMAPHPLGDLQLDGCRIPEDHLIGGEGHGFRLAMATLDRFRPTVGAAALGMGRRALHEATRHVMGRIQFGKPLSDQQLVKFKLAEMETRLEAARLLVYQAALVGDMGAERVTREAAMAKLFATEAASYAIDEAVQLLGGAGVIRGSIVERLYREVRPLRIYEGTSEIQHLVIADQLLRRYQ